MAKRVLIAGLFHETHTFLDGATGIGKFKIRRDGELLACRGDGSPLGGVLERAEEFGWQLVPAIDYRAQPGPIVEDEVLERFWEEFRERAEPAIAAGIDAVFLVLHGAMVTPACDDVEGELLARLRALPGAGALPVFGVFDLHANFSPAMASLSDGLVAYRENPHRDAREAACDAAALLQRCLQSGVRPAQRHRHAGIIWPPTGTGTDDDPMRSLEALARQLEARPEIWSANVVGGFAYADTPHSGVAFSAFGTDAEALEEALGDLVEEAWRRRAEGDGVDPSVAEVLPRVAALQRPCEGGEGSESDEGGLTVLVEPSDNIGGGAPGDGTGLLRALVEWRVGGSAVCLCDPASVAAAAEAGVGATLKLAVGGRGSRLDPGPFELSLEVVSLHEGHFRLEDPHSHLASMAGDAFDMGPCAVLRHRFSADVASGSDAGEQVVEGEGGVLTLLLTSVKTPPFDLGQWRSVGIEPAEFSVIVAKAAVAHRQVYDPVAARMWWVDTPGPCRSDLRKLPFEKLPRPIHPLT